MFKNLILTLVFSFTVLLSTIMLSTTVEAQQFQEGETTQEQTNPNQTGTTTQDDGLNWLWLLPLLAIPLLFLMRKGDTDEDQTHRPSQGYAGMKGGEAQRNRDGDDEE